MNRNAGCQTSGNNTRTRDDRQRQQGCDRHQGMVGPAGTLVRDVPADHVRDMVDVDRHAPDEQGTGKNRRRPYKEHDYHGGRDVRELVHVRDQSISRRQERW